MQIFLSDFYSQECESSNAKVRQAALAVVGELYSQLGPLVKAIAISNDQKIKSQLDSLFESIEFDKEAATVNRKRKCIELNS